MTKGQPCDYSGLSYEKLSQGSGIQWPCNERFRNGLERQYTDGVFNTDPERCEVYGHDLMAGAEIDEKHFRAMNPAGRAIIKAADYIPPEEVPDDDYPFFITTGRVVYHFHSRTKTGRTPELNRAAPEPYLQISEADAQAYSIENGDLVEVETRRGKVQAPARVGDILQGHLFVPFHYGYWDEYGTPRAANELTITGYDPVSKQPHFKYSAAKIRKV